MRYRLALGVLTISVTGCGFGSSSSKPAPTATPTVGTYSRVATIPQTTPPPVRNAGRGFKGRTHGPPVHPGVVRPVVPTPTPIPASAYSAQIFGRVTDIKTGRPLKGAIVTVGSGGRHVTRTGVHGRYRLAFPATLAIPVTVRLRGYTGALAMGRLAPHRSARVNFQLTHITPGKPVPPPAPRVFGSP